MNKNQAVDDRSENDAFVMTLFCFILLLTAIMSYVVGNDFGRTDGIEIMQKEAIQYKAARYNPDTAKFEWTQPVENNK